MTYPYIEDNILKLTGQSPVCLSDRFNLSITQSNSDNPLILFVREGTTVASWTFDNHLWRDSVLEFLLGNIISTRFV